MSRKTPGQWLLSHHSQSDHYRDQSHFQSAKTIAVSSGKGGVGKTSLAIKLAKTFSESNKKVLLIDCDFNLSNTAVKLGFPLQDRFYDLLTTDINFEDALYKDGNLHLLSACNGHLELFDSAFSLESMIFDIIGTHGKNYDYVVLDCPAGLSKEVCNLNAYCDYRFVVITPDKSSITDSYSLIKVLSQKLKINDYHLIFNKVSDENQNKRLTKTFLKTAEHFLNCRLKVLGSIPFYKGKVDQFDHELLKVAGSKIDNHFNKVIRRFAEEDVGSSTDISAFKSLTVGKSVREQEVPTL